MVKYIHNIQGRDRKQMAKQHCQKASPIHGPGHQSFTTCTSDETIGYTVDCTIGKNRSLIPIGRYINGRIPFEEVRWLYVKLVDFNRPGNDQRL